MTKHGVLVEVGKALDLLPSQYECVMCGHSVTIEWEWVRGGEDELDYAIEIRASNRLDGWCSYGGDDTFRGRRGLYCPKCHEKRRGA